MMSRWDQLFARQNVNPHLVIEHNEAYLSPLQLSYSAKLFKFEEEKNRKPNTLPSTGYRITNIPDFTPYLPKNTIFDYVLMIPSNMPDYRFVQIHGSRDTETPSNDLIVYDEKEDVREGMLPSAANQRWMEQFNQPPAFESEPPLTSYEMNNLIDNKSPILTNEADPKYHGITDIALFPQVDELMTKITQHTNPTVENDLMAAEMRGPSKKWEDEVYDGLNIKDQALISAVKAAPTTYPSNDTTVAIKLVLLLLTKISTNQTSEDYSSKYAFVSIREYVSQVSNIIADNMVRGITKTNQVIQDQPITS